MYIISTEKKEDFGEIYDLVKTAFETSLHADGDEHDYVNNLRHSPNYLPELAFKINDGSRIIGHIMLTRTFIDRQGIKTEALLLSPLCVQLEYRNRGVAGQLIRHSFDAARHLGFKAVFIVGDPAYYNRFGFETITKYGIRDSGTIPEGYAMVVELTEGYLGTGGGVISIY